MVKLQLPKLATPVRLRSPAPFFPFPVILAILLNEDKIQRFKKSVQTILTFPHFLSWVIVAGIMMNILANNGAVNNLLAAMGTEKYQFMTDKGLFRYILIFSLTWKESGWSTILYIAAITGIDPALYEAATIDGANRWHRIIHITWPGILPVVIITLILRVGHMMDAGFDQIMNMYRARCWRYSGHLYLPHHVPTYTELRL